MKEISKTDLIINPDGSAYHLGILPEDVADIVITVGDPERVKDVSRYFDHIELRKGKREFLTHTGRVGSRRVTVVSTGIGTDNIDIVMNELDALVNIDFNTRMVHAYLKSLNIIRVGTSGTIQDDVRIDSVLVSQYALGLDALMNYYVHTISGDEHELLDSLTTHLAHIQGISPYLTSADKTLLDIVGKDLPMGITVTAPGFYAPQGREVRAKNTVPNLVFLLNSFRHGNQRLTNMEMESAGIYALAKVLGHKAVSVNAILASRTKFEFSSNPQKTVSRAIQLVLERIEKL